MKEGGGFDSDGGFARDGVAKAATGRRQSPDGPQDVKEAQSTAMAMVSVGAPQCLQEALLSGDGGRKLGLAPSGCLSVWPVCGCVYGSVVVLVFVWGTSYLLVPVCLVLLGWQMK